MLLASHGLFLLGYFCQILCPSKERLTTMETSQCHYLSVICKHCQDVYGSFARKEILNFHQIHCMIHDLREVKNVPYNLFKSPLGTISFLQ